jgi:hypothetical protein
MVSKSRPTHRSPAGARRVRWIGIVCACLLFLAFGASACDDGQQRTTAKTTPNSEQVAWTAARRTDTIAGYRRYLGRYAHGPHSGQAKRTIAALAKNDALYRHARAPGSVAALRKFLRDFPGHRREAQARRRLRLLTARARERRRIANARARERRKDAAGRNIVDLIAEGKVTASVRGSDITTVTVNAKRAVNHDVTVKIPAGTFFAASGGAVQNMVATDSAEIELDVERESSTDVSVACANRTLPIPHHRNTFAIQRHPDQTALRKLIPALRRAHAGFPVRQAAVWIVTEGAGYEALGTLRYETGERVIKMRDYNRAIRIIRRAGL